MSVALVIPGRRRTKGIANPKRYLRRGRCSQCGWCCKREGCKDLVFVDSKYFCGLFHSKDRPLRCKLFPEDPPVLNPSCGYFWLDLWNGEKLVKHPKDMV